MQNNVRPETMERITTPALADAFIAEQVDAIRAQVGDKKAARYFWPFLAGWTAPLLPHC